jgi:hypothetical protein
MTHHSCNMHHAILIKTHTLQLKETSTGRTYYLLFAAHSFCSYFNPQHPFFTWSDQARSCLSYSNKVKLSSSSQPPKHSDWHRTCA